jgi:hypothetical protein
MSDAQLIYANWLMAVATIATAAAATASALYARNAISDQQKNFDKQLEEYKLALSAETVLKFRAAFDDPEFKKARRKAGEALLNRHNEAAAEEVFDFFDTVGLFVKLGALTEDIAYSVFFHWINLYWRAGKHYIGSKQMDTAALWKGFEFLYNRVCDIERRSHSDSEDLKMSDSRLRQQLEEEHRLDCEIVPGRLREARRATPP